jgi:hypothetical protein
VASVGAWPEPSAGRQYAEGMSEQVEEIPELDIAAMVADMRPPTDDVPIALDGSRLDTPAKVIAYLEQINARRDAAQRRAS